MRILVTPFPTCIYLVLSLDGDMGAGKVLMVFKLYILSIKNFFFYFRLGKEEKEKGEGD